MKRLMSALATVMAFGLFASADEMMADWFVEDAETVAGAIEGVTDDGVWSNLTDQVEVVDSRVVLDANDAAPVAYRPDEALMANAASIMLTDIVFDAARGELPELTSDAQAAVAITTNAEGACVFAVANDGEWKLTTTVADPAAAYVVKVDFTYADAKTVNYSVSNETGWVTLKSDAVNPVTMKRVSTVEFAGSGSFATLVGVYPLPPKGTKGNPWQIGAGDSDDVTAWTNANGRLEVSGLGDMQDFEPSAPWAGDAVTEILVEKSVYSIGANAFAGCTGLKTLVMEGEEPPELADGTVLEDVQIFVPAGAEEAYRTAEVWSGLAERIFAAYSRREEDLVEDRLYEVEYRWWDAQDANDIAEALASFLSMAPAVSTDDDFSPYRVLDWYEDLGAFEEVSNRLKRLSALCTSCRTGNFIGRNFDWAYDDVEECVMRVPAADGRFASIGIASRFFPEPWQTIFGVEDFLPELTMDGINEKGVAINVNVVPAGDNGATTGTNPGGERLCAGFAVRHVLDAATNAAHAVEILESKDIYSIPFLEFHWMISDSAESYIVECVSNKLVVLRAKDAQPKMANFYVSHSPSLCEYDVLTNAELTADFHTPHAMGIERYARVSNGLDRVDSVDAMFTNMTNVWYKLKYLPGNEERYWSDLNGAPVPGGETGQRFTAFDDTYELCVARSNAFKSLQANYVAVTNYEAQYGDRAILYDDSLTNQVVHTVHTSIYDLGKRTLRVCVQEDCQCQFDYALDPLWVNGHEITKDQIGVCSWTWHGSMADVLEQMKADGRYNGMQLALAPWLGIDSESLYFGGQEGPEVWDFIKDKIAEGKLNVMSTMINFPGEDYTTLTSITNTQGYMYGVREYGSTSDASVEHWKSNLYYTAEAARLTAELGVKTLTTESGFICIDPELMFQRVSEICATCQVYGVDFLIESGPQHPQFMTNLLTRLDAAGFHNVGVNFDPGDTALFGSEDPVESFNAMKPWIRMIHAKDCKPFGVEGGRATWNEDCVWGDGSVSTELDFGAGTFLTTLNALGYTGNILYERLSGDETLTRERIDEITLAMDRIFAELTEQDGTPDAPWLIGKTNPASVTAYTNGTMLVIAGNGAMKDFETVGPWGTAITAVDFGAQVATIGANAFAGCTLGTLTMGGNPPAIGSGNDLLAAVLTVREDAKAKFEAADGWKGCVIGTVVPVCYDWRNVKTLAPFLHEVWFDDYTFDEKGETLAGVESFSCSSVRNGNFIGRNFDFFLDDKPEFVVHVAANPAKGRLASVAMAMHTGMREGGVTNGQYTASYDLLPNRTLDGINEKGVAINQNVVAYDPEVAAGVGKEFTGTNPGAPNLNSSFVTRMVLDRATNAAHAVELIKSYNIFGISVSGDILHYMISDSKETYVVEIITNTVVARHMKVMTNFNLNWDNGNARAVTDADTNECWTADWYPEPTNLVIGAGNFNDATNALATYYARHAEGVERFVRLRDHYDDGATFEGMAALMRRAQYSQSSTFETQPYWYSDRCSVEMDKELSELGYPGIANTYMLYGLKYYKDEADPKKLLDKEVDDILETYFMKKECDCLEHKDDHRKDNCGVWLTVHNTTYDISNRMFRVVVQEDYDHTFDIYLADKPVEPLAPGEAIGPYMTAAKATNVANKAVLVPSAEVAKVLTTEDLRADYVKKFGFPVTYRSGEESGWYVEAMLTAAGSNDLVRSANTVTTNINLAAIAALVGETTTSMTLMGGITGFYYSLHVGDAVTNIVPDVNEKNLNVLCGKEEIGKVTFPEVKKPSDAAGFFTVGVTATPDVDVWLRENPDGQDDENFYGPHME